MQNKYERDALSVAAAAAVMTVFGPACDGLTNTAPPPDFSGSRNPLPTSHSSQRAFPPAWNALPKPSDAAQDARQGRRTRQSPTPARKPVSNHTQVTNLRITIDPRCATLTWTAPTGSLITHYRLSRVIRPCGAGTGTIPVLEVLEERLPRSTTRYRNCSAEYRVDGNDYGYRPQHLGENGETDPGLLTPVKFYGAQGCRTRPVTCG